MAQRRFRILAVDDELIVLKTLDAILGSSFEFRGAQNPYEAEKYLAEKPDLLLLDLNLRPFDGLQWLEKWKRDNPQLECVVVSAESSLPRAVECMRLGAVDYLMKPFRAEDLRYVIDRVLDKQRLKKEHFQRAKGKSQFVGQSKLVQELLSQVDRLRGQRHLNVLILGETGTGKEVLARTLHEQEDAGPFVIVNTPALPATLVESELFGVEAGAFTDAKKSRPGKFEQADGGDIFLDEIGDLAIEAQPKVLRVLQEKHFERVGGQKLFHSQFRVISATNRPVSQLLSEQKFREDLFFRLADFVLFLPPLRERKEDIPLLAQHFFRLWGADFSRLSPSALEQLCRYSWPGNVRQLESTLKRAVVLNPLDEISEIEILDFKTLGQPASPSSQKDGLSQRVLEFEKRLLQETLDRFPGDRASAKKALQISNATFYRKLQQHNL